MNDKINGEKKPLIQVRNLYKKFEQKDVLKNISVDINEGDVVCVIGPSGSGKSTFLRCLNRLEEPTGGHILFDGEDICDRKTDIDLHRQKMGMVFQQFNLFPHMTILGNLTVAPMGLQKKITGRSRSLCHAVADPRWFAGQGRRLSEPAFRRTTAENRDCTCTVHAAGSDVVR